MDDVAIKIELEIPDSERASDTRMRERKELM